jgi:tripartite-type tricarboxylate transporter receptor subunit TctC
MKAALLTILVMLAAAALPDALAQNYPTKPIRLVSPFAPGGGTDILSRLIAGPVSESLGQTVVVDNRPGAGGAIGAELTAHAEPDGYTLIMVSSSYTAGAAFHKVPYDPVNGIQPILLVGTTGLVMTVHPSVPAKTPGEFIDHAKGRPGRLNYATVGTGSVTHLAHEQLKLMTGIDIVHVPYKGGGPALTAVVAGESQVSMISMVPTLPHVRAGRLRAIGVTTPARMDQMPNVPAIAETVRGFELLVWNLGAEGTPGAHRRALEQGSLESAIHAGDEAPDAGRRTDGRRRRTVRAVQNHPARRGKMAPRGTRSKDPRIARGSRLAEPLPALREPKSPVTSHRSPVTKTDGALLT